MANRKDIYNIFDMLKSKGRYGDTELAHITKEEANLLKSRGGSGTINPETGLKEYFFGAQGSIGTSGEPDVSIDTIGLAGEGAGTISYDDYKQFLDPNTGLISDTEGMKNFLKQNKQLRRLGYVTDKDFYTLMAGMPSLGLDPYDLKSGQAKYQAGLEGMQTKLQQESKTKSSQRISTGVISPAAEGEGLGYLSSQELTPYLQEGSQFAREKGNIYGLGQESSDALVAWISSLPERALYGSNEMDLAIQQQRQKKESGYIPTRAEQIAEDD